MEVGQLALELMGRHVLASNNQGRHFLLFRHSPERNKILKTKTKKDIGTLKKSNEECTDPGLDTLKELANKHYPSHTEKKNTIHPNTSILREELETRYTDWITN